MEKESESWLRGHRSPYEGMFQLEQTLLSALRIGPVGEVRGVDKRKPWNRGC